MPKSLNSKKPILEPNFSFDLTDESFLSKYVMDKDIVTAVIIAPSTNLLFKYNGSIDIIPRANLEAILSNE